MIDCRCTDESWGSCPQHGKKAAPKVVPPLESTGNIKAVTLELPPETIRTGALPQFPPAPDTLHVELKLANPKTLMGRLKVAMLSVVPPASIIGEALAMQYGAFEAPRADGTKGYGPYNWREQNIEAMTYVDAAMRHLMSWVDGEEVARDSLIGHLNHAKATIGILIDAIENGTWIDNRPKVRKNVAADLFEKYKKEVK